MKRWIIALSVLILGSCSSPDQLSSNLSYEEAEQLISESPLLSTTAALLYDFEAEATTGSLSGAELKGKIIAQGSDYPASDFLPTFTIFEGQLVLEDSSSLDASGLILGELLYVFFSNAEANTFIKGRGIVAEDDSVNGSFLALIGGASGEGTWQAVPSGTPTPNPEDPTDPADPTDPEDPSDPTDPEDPTDPADPTDPEEPEDPADPTEPEEPTDPEEPEEPEDPADPTEPEEPEDPTEPEEPGEPEDPEGPGGDLPAPPETLNDPVRNGNPEVTRVFYDDEIAVYFGAGMDPTVDWMNDHIRDTWRYMKETYGSFGPDPRMYVIAHKQSNPGYATIRNYFDDDFSGTNAILLGGGWDWETPSSLGYEVITHELGHIVEGANNNVWESPSFEFWGDSKWADIFIYDVYKALGQDDWAQDWFERMQTSRGGYNNAYQFRDWYYPIYEQYGNAEVYDRYFELLAECFPQIEVESNGKQVPRHARRATPGEVLHFFSGAAGEDLSNLFDTAFGLTSEVQSQFERAQQEMTCAATY